MSEFVDIHAHVLPGIDDGPADLEESLAMLRAAADAGTATIAATPHLSLDFPDVRVEELAERCAALRAEIEHHGIPIRLAGGAEVSLVWALEAGDEQLKLASYRQHGTDLLLETPTTNAAAVEPAFHHLAGKGYRVTLAHPERGQAFQRDYERLLPLIEQGLLLAVNAGALLDRRASPPGRLARRLCTEGLAHAIVSDGHRAARWRPVTLLEQAMETVVGLVGPQRASWMAEAAPAAILEGIALPSPPPVQRRRHRLFG